MKINTLLLASLLFAILPSCSGDDSSTTTTTITEENTTTINTWVKLTAKTADGVNKQNYKIMMFDQPVSSTSELPPIKMEITTDANGLAYFDLNQMITSTTPRTYYFEAFVETSAGYVWKSISHPAIELSKGRMVTTSIIVN